eukprot:scaffold284063_cov25-Prasinocladus_malaysianus.AAC.1
MASMGTDPPALILSMQVSECSMLLLVQPVDANVLNHEMDLASSATMMLISQSHLLYQGNIHRRCTPLTLHSQQHCVSTDSKF